MRPVAEYLQYTFFDGMYSSGLLSRGEGTIDVVLSYKELKGLSEVASLWKADNIVCVENTAIGPLPILLMLHGPLPIFINATWSPSHFY